MAKSLDANEANCRVILDSTAVSIYEIDQDGICTFCNVTCYRKLGYDNQSDLLGEHVHTLVHHTRADGSPYPSEDCQICKAFIENESSPVETEVFFRKDRSSFPVEYWSHPVNRDGKTTG